MPASVPSSSSPAPMVPISSSPTSIANEQGPERSSIQPRAPSTVQGSGTWEVCWIAS